MLSVTSIGDELLVNDFVPRVQDAARSSAAVTASAETTIVVYEGKGPNDRHGVFAERLSAGGETLTPSFQVNSTRRGEQHSPAVASDEGGGFVVAWAGRGMGDKQGVYSQRFSADGLPLGEETRANETTGGKQAEPAIAVAGDGSFTIAWSGVGPGDDSGVFLRRFSASGDPIGGEVLVNREISDHQSSPDLAFDDSGSLVVAWQSRHQDGSDWGVYGQWFAADGSRMGGETSLNTTTVASQKAPTVANDPTAGVVVGWQSRDQDGDSWGVVAREFTANGVASSAEVLLNEETEGHQQDPAIAVADDGRWLTAWTDGKSDGAGREVVSRTFDASGIAGDTEPVNRETSGRNSGHQRSPALATLGDDAVIVWSGNGATDHDGVHGQRYAIDLDGGLQQPPQLAPIDDRSAGAGMPLEIIVTATDPNRFDMLTFLLDVDDSPAGATLEPIDNNTARIAWSPPMSSIGQNVLFRVIVIDDGEPPLADSEDFLINVTETGVVSPSAQAVDEAFGHSG